MAKDRKKKGKNNKKTKAPTNKVSSFFKNRKNKLPPIKLDEPSQVNYVKTVYEEADCSVMNPKKLTIATFNRETSFVAMTYDCIQIYNSGNGLVAVMVPEAEVVSEIYNLIPKPTEDEEVVDDGTEDKTS